MWVRERALNEKWRARVRACVAFQELHRLFRDVAGRIEPLWNACAPRLRRDVFVARKLVGRTAQRIRIGVTLPELLIVMSDRFVAMADGELHVAESVIR